MMYLQLNLTSLLWYLINLIEEVIELSTTLNVSFHHTKRSANDKADQPAKHGVLRLELLIFVDS